MFDLEYIVGLAGESARWAGLIAFRIAVIAFLSWIAYLAFCAWIVHRTGTTSSLHDVAAAARAFRGFIRLRRRPHRRRKRPRA